MDKFRITLETSVVKPNQYVGQENISQSLLNELVKQQLTKDLSDALRTYGVKAQVTKIRKVANATN